MSKHTLDNAIKFMNNFLDEEYNLWQVAHTMPGKDYFDAQALSGAKKVLGLMRCESQKKYKNQLQKVLSMTDPQNEGLKIFLTPPRDISPEKQWFEEMQEKLKEKKKRELFVAAHYNHPTIKDLFCFYTGAMDTKYDYGIHKLFLGKEIDGEIKLFKELSRCFMCSGTGIHKPVNKDPRTCTECAGSGWLDGRGKMKMKFGKLIEVKGLKEPLEADMKLYEKLTEQK